MMLFLHIILNVSLIRLVWLTKCRRKDLHVPEPLQIILDGRADHSSSQKSLRIKEYTASGWLKRAPSDTFCLGKTHLISPFHGYTQNARQDDFEIQTNQSDTLQEHDGNVIVASIAYVCQKRIFQLQRREGPAEDFASSPIICQTDVFQCSRTFDVVSRRLVPAASMQQKRIWQLL